MSIKIKTGTAAADTLTSLAGTNALFGLAGNDILRGSVGTDYLSGGLGDDVLEGGAGADKLHGGAGNDTFLYKNATDANGDMIQDFAVGDRIDFSALAAHKFIGNAMFNGVAGEIRYGDPLFGSNLPINFPGPLVGNINVGGIGLLSSGTTIEIDVNGDGIADVSMNLKNKVNLVETAANSGLLMIADNISKTGTANNDSLQGGSGNDYLSGLAGNDSLVGGEGDDHLYGGDGNDMLDGGFGRDVLIGGAGNDVFRFTEPDGINNDIIRDFAAGDVLFVNIPDFQLWGNFVGDAEFSGQTGEYRFVQATMGPYMGMNDARLDFDFNGDGQADSSIILQNFSGMLQKSTNAANKLAVADVQVFNGTAAADSKTTGNGNDTLNGGDGDDNLNGGMGNDTLDGGAGNDNLTGGSGDDVLIGGDGNDVLLGGQGSDTLTGGAGDDVFKFKSLAEISSQDRNSFVIDTITDFAVGDKIDLSGIDADINQAGNQAFTFIGSNPFTGTEGELHLMYGSIAGDVNGDGITDFQIGVGYSVTLSATDFIL